MYYAGIDLGGTNIAAGIVDENGVLVRKGSVPTGRTRPANEIIYDMCMLVKSLMGETGIKESQLLNIGIGSPGTPDRENGVLIYTNNIDSFRNVPIRAEIQKYISVPVYLENDANCAAIAESVAGAAKDANYAIIITIGTGIGGGVIINRKLYTGFNGAAGELGHTVISMNGEPCTCGRKGCWEAYSAATALIRQTKHAAMENKDSKIHELVSGDLDKIDAKTAFDAARLNDPTGIRVVETYIDMLADGLANMVNVFQPDVVVIGGGVSKEGDNILVPLREKVGRITYCAEGVAKTRIVAAKMGNDAGIIGAALITKA